MILHIPHSIRAIPDEYRDLFVLSDADLSAELLRLSDAYTDELFTYPEAVPVVFPFSRLLVDVERFPDDEQEPMAKVGMGWCYTHTTDGRQLKRDLSAQEREHLRRIYDRHHAALDEAVQNELDLHGRALIVDCHSFPSEPLPCDLDQSTPRPDFCIGTDDYHTPTELVTGVQVLLAAFGYSVAINRPYSGSMVPLRQYGQDKRVASIMIEVNRALYMNEATGEKSDRFGEVRSQLSEVLRQLAE
jgi:N-formylglutamate amidohydrolase